MLFIGIALCFSMASTAMSSGPVQDDDVGKNELISDYKVNSFDYAYTIVESPSFTYCQVELVCENANVNVSDTPIVAGLYFGNTAEYVDPPAWLVDTYSYTYIAASNTSTKPGYIAGNFDTAISRGGTGLYDTTFDLKS